MATPTYDPIASTTLSSAASSVTFSSLDTIAAGYRDLVLVANVGNAYGNAFLQINGSISAIWNDVYMVGTGSAAYSGSRTNAYPLYLEQYIASETSVTNSYLFSFLDYATTDKHKSVLMRYNASGGLAGVQASALRWASTSAVTSITFSPAAPGEWTAGSTFSLYGIVA